MPSRSKPAGRRRGACKSSVVRVLGISSAVCRTGVVSAAVRRDKLVGFFRLRKGENEMNDNVSQNVPEFLKPVYGPFKPIDRNLKHLKDAQDGRAAYVDAHSINSCVTSMNANIHANRRLNSKRTIKGGRNDGTRKMHLKKFTNRVEKCETIEEFEKVLWQGVLFGDTAVYRACKYRARSMVRAIERGRCITLENGVMLTPAASERLVIRPVKRAAHKVP